MNIKSLFTTAIASLGILGAIAGCDKPYELDIPLGITTRDVQLKKEAGSTHVLVYSTGSWTACFAHEADWASLNKLSGEGNADFVLTYSYNYGLPRAVTVILESGSIRDSIVFTQAGSTSDATLSFGQAAVSLFNAAASVSMPLSTSAKYNLSDASVVVNYEGEDKDWIQNVQLGSSAVTFDVLENATDLSRAGSIIVSLPNAKVPGTSLIETVLSVTQTSTCDVKFVLDEVSSEVAGVAGSFSVTASENTIWPYAKDVVISLEGVDETEPWITSSKISKDGLSYSVTANDSGAKRSGKININYSIAGKSVSASYQVTQRTLPTEISFEDVRVKGSCTLSGDNYLEGFIVSDPTSKNICQNPQSKQFWFELDENDKTGYFESKDGKYGYMIKFDSAETAKKIARYTRVKILVEGLEQVKESDPDRFILKGISEDRIFEIGSTDYFAVPVKKRSVSELSAADLYTLVSVKDLEIYSKEGCYTNCTDGYSYRNDELGINPSGSTTSPRWDTAPLMMYDKMGNTVSMLTNGCVSWRRDGKDMQFNTVVPQGSGTFNGILVCETLPRFNMESVGKFQLRAMTEDDIALNESAAFTKTLTEWNWMNNLNDMVPEIGSGSIETYTLESLEPVCSLTADFNNVTGGVFTPGTTTVGGNGGSTTNQKGCVVNSAMKIAARWWDFTNDKPGYFDIKLSTAGVSGSKLLFCINWGHGDMSVKTLDAPAHWNLYYSIDGGVNFTKVDGNIIKNRSIVWWGITNQDSCPGYQEYVRALPTECFGKDNLVLRMQVADKVTDNKAQNKTLTTGWETNCGVEKATLSPNDVDGKPNYKPSIRIGNISIRYN